MTAFDAVVFDLDNTLCRHAGDLEAAYWRAFERVGCEPFGSAEELFAALDGPPGPDDMVGYLGAGFARVAAQHGRSAVDPLALAAGVIEEIDTSDVAFLPGAEAALSAARSQGPVGILTNGPADRQEGKVRTLGLEDRVDTVVYAGDLPRRKPHVEPFEAVLTALGTAASRTLYVGDSLKFDVAGAHNAGLQVAWLRADSGAESDEPDESATEDAGDYRPEYVLDSLDELSEVLEL